MKRHQNLPKGMRVRVRKRKYKNDVMYYFYETRNADGKRVEISLGKDYIQAINKWSELSMSNASIKKQPTFLHLAERFKREYIYSENLRPNSVVNYNKSLKQLSKFFGNPDVKLDLIKPEHIAQYLDWRRNQKTAANLEITLFKLMWKQAILWGLTEKLCPASVVKLYKKTRRENYAEDHIVKLIKDNLNIDMYKDILDLTYILGQRPSDIVKIRSQDISDGVLNITQVKTGAKVRFEVQGLLKEILDKYSNITGCLFKNSRNKTLTVKTLSSYIHKLKSELAEQYPEYKEDLLNFQIRDLRAKSATDIFLSGGIEQAREQLGHTSTTMTKVYIRKDKVLKPLK